MNPDRIKRVLEAALHQFAQNGFDRTTVESIANLSGVSKVTIYNYFPSKEALLEAAIAQCSDGLFASIPASAFDPKTPEVALSMIGSAFVKLIRRDEILGLFRLMYAAAGEHVAVCEAFYRQGPRKTIGQLSHYLKMANAVGSLKVPDPDLAADQFLATFLGDTHTRLLLKLGRPNLIEDSRLVGAAVTSFLRTYAAP